MVCYIAIHSNLVEFTRIYSDLVGFGRIWSSLLRFGRIARSRKQSRAHPLGSWTRHTVPSPVLPKVYEFVPVP
jgi:hypothetical protein